MPQKQSQRLAQIAYYQAGKIVVQTLLPQHPPVALTTLNFLGITPSTSADTHIPVDNAFNIQCCSFLETRLIGLYGGKAASLLLEYQYRVTSDFSITDRAPTEETQSKGVAKQQKPLLSKSLILKLRGKKNGYKSLILPQPSFANRKHTLAKRSLNKSYVAKLSNQRSSTSMFYFLPASSPPLFYGLQNKEPNKEPEKDSIDFSATLRKQDIPPSEIKSINNKLIDKASSSSDSQRSRGTSASSLRSNGTGKHSIAPQGRSIVLKMNALSYGRSRAAILPFRRKEWKQAKKLRNYTNIYKNKEEKALVLPVPLLRKEEVEVCKDSLLAKVGFAGAGNNPFQSNIGIIENQTACRLATTMVNNWSLYSFNSISDLSQVAQYSKPFLQNQCDEVKHTIRRKTPLTNIQMNATSFQCSRSICTSAFSFRRNGSFAKKLVSFLRNKREARFLRTKRQPHSFWVAKLSKQTAEGQQKNVTQHHGQPKLSQMALIDEKHLRFAISQTKNPLKLCESNKLSYSDTRISVEDVGEKMPLWTDVFQLVNPLQFSNVQRDRFHPGWFRLYLPDIEATEFLKNVADYYFNLSLQTLMRPSVKEQNRMLYASIPLFIAPQSLLAVQLLPPEGGLQLHSQLLRKQTPAGCATVNPLQGVRVAQPVRGLGKLKDNKKGTDIKIAYRKEFFSLVCLGQAWSLSFGDGKSEFASESNVSSACHDADTSLNLDAKTCSVVPFLPKSFLKGKPLLRKEEAEASILPKDSLIQKMFFCCGDNNLSIGIGLLRSAAKHRYQLNVKNQYFFKQKRISNEKSYPTISMALWGFSRPLKLNRFINIGFRQAFAWYKEVSKSAECRNQNSSLESSALYRKEPALALPPLLPLLPSEAQEAQKVQHFTSLATHVSLKSNTNNLAFGLLLPCEAMAFQKPSEEAEAFILPKDNFFESFSANQKQRVLDKGNGFALRSKQTVSHENKSDTKRLACLDVFPSDERSKALLLEKQMFPLLRTGYKSVSVVEKEFLSHALVNNCFAKAFLLVNQNRQLVDYFADYLIRFHILRQHQILYLFSAILLSCKK